MPTSSPDMATPAPAPLPAPAWYDEFSSSLLYARHLVLTGNIRDLFPVGSGQEPAFVDMAGALARLLAREGGQGPRIIRFDPVSGLHPDRAAGGEGDVAAPLQTPREWVDGPEAAMEELVETYARLQAETGHAVLLVVDYASHIAPGNPAARDEFFVRIDQIGRASPDKDGPGRVLTVWLADRIGDLPEWFTIGNSQLREIHVDMPDLEQRYRYAEGLCRRLEITSRSNEVGHDWGLQQFALECDGEPLVAMRAIAAIAKAEAVPLNRISDAIRIYRTGLRRNPWGSQVLADRVRQGRNLLGRRIKGQDHAIERTIDILSRSLIGLSGAQSGSRHSKPRGVMFYAGPTGVGKTELAKAVTELLFGDDTACHRFDMSEFMQEDSVTRLIGAPPGHPGHESGGELVNAALHRPFSVFLFDEVEKAHPRILDIFLQIIDEGRLTDARGATAHFSESLIIFTSNIGVMKRSSETNLGMNVLPSDSHEELEEKIQSAIRSHFRITLQRPELLNRIGPNIIVFDFLSAEAAVQIFHAILERVLEAVRIERGITVTVLPEVVEQLRFLCIEDYFEGGRGIGNRFERYFVNPLSREIFDGALTTDFEVVGLKLANGRSHLSIRAMPRA